MRLGFVVAFLSLVGSVFAATLTVSTPSEGDFLGRTNNISFNGSDVDTRTTITVTATQVANPSNRITVTREFNPSADKTISGSVPLNFSETTPNGAYTLEIVATAPGDVFNSIPARTVQVDVVAPKFLNFNPISNMFVRGQVLITATFEEENIKEWRVQVDGNDIPNNTGTTTEMSVPWDASATILDGAKSVNISIEDKAGNRANRTISLTVDRIRPAVTIAAPLTGETVRPGARLPVVVEIADQFNNSVDVNGVDVSLVGMDGTPLARVARRSVRANGSRLTWTGRVRATGLPSQFRVVVTVRDKAGNEATLQEVTVSVGRSRSKAGADEDEILPGSTWEAGFRAAREARRKARGANEFERMWWGRGSN